MVMTIAKMVGLESTPDSTNHRCQPLKLRFPTPFYYKS